MIGRIKGTLLEKKMPELLMDVQGIGYEITAPLSTCYQLPPVGERVELFTHFVVREDAHQLYGFLQRMERDLFRVLIKVNGVGPKLGLAILSSMEVPQFIQCIMSHDVNALVALPGIGKKTAERLIIEMSDRLKDWEGASENLKLSGASGTSPMNSSKVKDAISALVALGYKPQEASRAMMQVDHESLSTEDMVKEALRQMSPCHSN